MSEVTQSVESELISIEFLTRKTTTARLFTSGTNSTQWPPPLLIPTCSRIGVAKIDLNEMKLVVADHRR